MTAGFVIIANNGGYACKQLRYICERTEDLCVDFLCLSPTSVLISSDVTLLFFIIRYRNPDISLAKQIHSSFLGGWIDQSGATFLH